MFVKLRAGAAAGARMQERWRLNAASAYEDPVVRVRKRLVPNHDRDGEDVEKYFRRVSFPNGMCWFDLFKCLAHSQFGSGVCECA